MLLRDQSESGTILPFAGSKTMPASCLWTLCSKRCAPVSTAAMKRFFSCSIPAKIQEYRRDHRRKVVVCGECPDCSILRDRSRLTERVALRASERICCVCSMLLNVCRSKPTFRVPTTGFAGFDAEPSVDSASSWVPRVRWNASNTCFSLSPTYQCACSCFHRGFPVRVP